MVSLSQMRTPHVQTGSPGSTHDFCCSVVGNLATSGCRRSIGLGFDPLGPVHVSVVSIVIADVRVWGHMASLMGLRMFGRICRDEFALFVEGLWNSDRESRVVLERDAFLNLVSVVVA